MRMVLSNENGAFEQQKYGGRLLENAGNFKVEMGGICEIKVESIRPPNQVGVPFDPPFCIDSFHPDIWDRIHTIALLHIP